MFRNHTNMQDWNDRECATHKPINSSKYFLILPPVINHSQANQVEPTHIILRKYPFRSLNLPINNKKGLEGVLSHMCNSSLMKYFLSVVSHASPTTFPPVSKHSDIYQTQHNTSFSCKRIWNNKKFWDKWYFWSTFSSLSQYFCAENACVLHILEMPLSKLTCI